jgi:hypothetical protein
VAGALCMAVVMVMATWFCFAKRMGGNNPD